MASKAPGCYKSVKGQDYVDYMIKCGMPKDQAQKFLGSHWTFKFGQPEGESNKRVWWIQCEEVPEMNMLDSGTEGVEKTMDHPLCGGKAKLTFTKAGPNCFKSTFQTDAYGEFTTVETFTDEGYHVESCMKGGASLKEFWPRYVNESGFFKYEKSENMEAYCKAQGMTEDMICGMKDMTMHQKICGNKVWLKESFGSQGTAINTGTLDEECTYKWDQAPQFNKKYVMTRVGPGKFKYIVKGADGRVEDVDMTMCEEGICYNMTDKMSGQCSKLWMKRYFPFDGKYKMVAMAGFEEYGAAQGMTSLINCNVKWPACPSTAKTACFTSSLTAKSCPLTAPSP